MTYGTRTSACIIFAVTTRDFEAAVHFRSHKRYVCGLDEPHLGNRNVHINSNSTTEITTSDGNAMDQSSEGMGCYDVLHSLSNQPSHLKRTPSQLYQRLCPFQNPGRLIARTRLLISTCCLGPDTVPRQYRQRDDRTSLQAPRNRR